MVTKKEETGFYTPKGTEVFSEEDLAKLDYPALRALIRQAAGWVDGGRQRYSLRPPETVRVPERARRVLRAALATWEKKGYQTKPDIAYAYQALRLGDEFEESLTYHPTPPRSPYEASVAKNVAQVIAGRRSIRRFADREVSEELLERVLQAATWAPIACSLQGCRYIVVKEAETKKLLTQPWGAAPLIIIGALDQRVYRFIKDNKVPYNPYLDLGAAMQSMALMAHALGLASCWASFSEELDLMRLALGVPEQVKIISYMALGWAEDDPTFVPRMGLEDVVHRERWTGP